MTTWSQARTAKWQLAVRLVLLCALVCLSGRPGSWQGGWTGRGVACEVRARAHRRLLAQQPAEPAIATFSQAVLVPPGSEEDVGGTVLLPGLAPLGTVLQEAAANLLATAEDCSRACRAQQQCNTFWYCEREGGCASAAYNLSSPHQGCQLVDQQVTQAGTGRPVLLVPAPGFVGGAPLRIKVPEVEGYDVWPGLGFWYRYDFECPDSVSQPGSCGLRGSPQEHAARCEADPTCQVMMYFPDGRDYPGAGEPVVLLKGGQRPALDITNSNINLNAVLYKKKKGAGAASASPGLSAGAIAGIVVGATCAAFLAAAAVVFAVRRRRGRRLEGGRAEESPGSSKEGTTPDGPTPLDLTPYTSGSALAAGQPPDPDGPHTGGALAASTAVEHSTAKNGLPAASCAAPLSLVSSSVHSSIGLAARLPLGTGVSVSTAALGAPDGRPAFTPAPPTSLASSLAARGRLARPLPIPAAVAPAGAAAATAGPQRHAGTRSSPSVNAQSLLSHLPTYGWQRSIVEYSAIQFVVDADGALDELGTGSSATVYRVLLNGVEAHAAKVFRLGSDPEMQLYFLEEASLLRLLRHRCIVGFAGVCVDDGNGIILMELMEGGDLRTRNREVDASGQRTFGWYQRGRRVALDVACALNYLHSETYTHFDVKARNVLLSRDMTAKLADVGFARAMRATHHSIEGPTGTFDYMAPELLTGRKCNSSVDIYSFGVLLWELCTGRPPLRGSLREPSVPQECPQAVATLMAQCLQEEPSGRPTAAQLVERLTKLQ